MNELSEFERAKLLRDLRKAKGILDAQEVPPADANIIWVDGELIIAPDVLAEPQILI